MSEYQCYEFQAVDRPLTGQEMSKLRAISSRARITSTSFVNVCNYSDFRGDPEVLVEKYFDSFVYVANWGSHHFTIRVPKKSFGNREWAPFCAGDCFQARSKKEHVVLSFHADELETDWEEGEDWMDALLPIREDLLRGDFRALYLGWLLGVQHEEVDDDQPEPPVPSGLGDLSAPLHSLAEFLDIDPNLLEAAAEASLDLKAAAPLNDLRRWIASLPAPEKDSVLFQVASGADSHAIAGLVRRFQRECLKATTNATRARRTAGELRAAAERLR